MKTLALTISLTLMSFTATASPKGASDFINAPIDYHTTCGAIASYTGYPQGVSTDHMERATKDIASYSRSVIYVQGFMAGAMATKKSPKDDKSKLLLIAREEYYKFCIDTGL